MNVTHPPTAEQYRYLTNIYNASAFLHHVTGQHNRDLLYAERAMKQYLLVSDSDSSVTSRKDQGSSQ